MNVYISYVIYNKTKKYSYSKIACKSILSLLKNGFNPENIICLVCEKKTFNFFKNQFPKSIIFLVNKKPDKKLKGWFIKPIAHYEFVHTCELNNPYLYAMSDVDIIFHANPAKYLLLQESDVWSRAQERYLRPTNRKRLLKQNPNFVKPRLNNLDELTAYMGRTRAYFFVKNKMTQLPSSGLYSDFVSTKGCIHKKLISKWYKMFCDIVKYPKFCTGDQEILCSAISALRLSRKSGGLDFVEHFQSGKKKFLG